MAYAIAVFSSLNLVNRVKNRLNQGDDYFAMIRAPQRVAVGGCSFALRFEDGKLPLVQRTAQELGIAVNGIYREEDQADGSRIYIPVK